MTKPRPAPHSRAGRAAGWRFALPLVVLWVVPVVLFALAFPGGKLLESGTVVAQPPRVVEVGQRDVDFRTSATLRFTMDAGPDLQSAASGTVTALGVHPGSEIAEGVRVASVDGASVFASVGGVPFYRSIGAGATGADVTELCRLLSARGALPSGSSCSSADQRVVRAIRTLQRSAHQPVTGVFDPRSTVFVPASATIVMDVAVNVGQPVTSTWVLAHTEPSPTSMVVSAADSGGDLSALWGQDVVATAGATSVTVRSLSPSGPESTTGSGVARLFSTLSDGASTGNLVETNEEGLTTFSGIVLALAVPRSVGVVPSSAIFTDSRGTSCIIAVDRRDSLPLPIVIAGASPLVGEIGLVAVDAGLAGRRIESDVSAMPLGSDFACA